LRVAYIDTSYLVAIAFAEPGYRELMEIVREMDAVFSATLLESEFLAVADREGLREPARRMLDSIGWVHPDRRLTAEIESILDSGYLRGADLHHLATARFLFPDSRQAFFLSLDKRQIEVAAVLGFMQPA
jgi:predicted nucleic acid-binding protein